MDVRLTGSVVPRGLVSGETFERMFDLFRAHYAHVDRDAFLRDHAEKDWIVLLADPGGVLRGFTTLKLYDLPFRGRRLRAVFNGNTIIEPACWGGQALSRTWIRFMARLKAEAPSVPLYWFLACSGYRTYLYLPTFFRRFHPRHDQAAPDFEVGLIDHLGAMKFPREYRKGVVRVERPRECLRDDLAVPPEARLADPNVRFFLDRNPGYRRGDELVCLAEFAEENLRRSLAAAPRVEVVTP